MGLTGKRSVPASAIIRGIRDAVGVVFSCLLAYLAGRLVAFACDTHVHRLDFWGEYWNPAAIVVSMVSTRNGLAGHVMILFTILLFRVITSEVGRWVLVGAVLGESIFAFW
jgi:hypothetical protein